MARKPKVKIGEGIELTADQYSNLRSYVFKAVEAADRELSQRVSLATYVDKAIYLYKQLNAKERKLYEANEAGRQRHSVRAELPSVDAHINAAVTDIMDVLVPIGNAYQGTASADLQDTVNAVTGLMERDAELFDHENAIFEALRDGFTYNIGGCAVDWVELQFDEAVIDYAENGDMTSGVPKAILENVKGNELRILDMYNTFFDPVVMRDPSKAYRKARYCGTHYLESLGQFLERVDNEYYSNTSEILVLGDGNKRSVSPRGNSQYPMYRTRPTLHSYVSTTNDQAAADYFSNFDFLAPDGRFVETPGDQIQLTEIYMRLKPSAWKLTSGTANTYELWKFIVADGREIVRAEKVNTAYNFIPYFFNVPAGRQYGTAAPSYALKLLPAQDWVIERLITRDKADRRKLYGETYYDPHRIPEIDPEEYDAIAQRIPVQNPSSSVENPVAVRDAIQKYYESPDVSGLQSDFAVAEMMMNKVLPISSRQMIADLQRATTHQSVHAAMTMNKPMLRLAKRADAQMLAPNRAQQIRNHELLQGVISVANPDDPTKPIDIDPRSLIGTQVDFSIGGGLQGFDTMTKITVLQDLWGVLVQSPSAQNVDMLAMVEYISKLMGEKADFSKFKYVSPMDALPVEVRNQAYQMLQQLQAQQQQGGQTPPEEQQ